MSTNTTILFRKIIASSLFLLLFFISVAKSVHHHPPASFADHPDTTLTQAGQQHCDICAFQLTKDAVTFCGMDATEYSLPCAAIASATYSCTLCEGPDALTSRGPPAC